MIQSLEELIVPGRVLRLFCSLTVSAMEEQLGPAGTLSRETSGDVVLVRVVDWENPAANDFLLVSQMTVTGQLYACRPDLVGFVNGLPWAGLPCPSAAGGRALKEVRPWSQLDKQCDLLQ